MATAKAARPHYFPASLIGGFGEPDTGSDRHVGHLRYAWVCVRRAADPGTVTRVRGYNVAIQNGIYDVAEPGPDLPADFAEQLWQQYEGALPEAHPCPPWRAAPGRGMIGGPCSCTYRPSRSGIQISPGPCMSMSARPPRRSWVRTTYRPSGSAPYQGHFAWMARARFAVFRHHKPAERFLIMTRATCRFMTLACCAGWCSRCQD